MKLRQSFESRLEGLKHPYKELPPDYFQNRADQDINRILHFAGRKALSSLQRVEGKRLTVVSHPTVVSAVETGESVLVLPNHRSWMDIGFFVEATQRVGLKYTRPFSKPGNIQHPQPIPWFFHKVGLISRGDAQDTEGVARVFKAMKEHGQHPLIFPEETRIKDDVRRVHKLKRTAALMALMFDMPIAPLGIAGAGTGETVPSRHSLRGRHIQVADTPVAQFGSIIRFERPSEIDEGHIVRIAGILTREVLTPALQSTVDAAYATRETLQRSA